MQICFLVAASVLLFFNLMSLRVTGTRYAELARLILSGARFRRGVSWWTQLLIHIILLCSPYPELVLGELLFRCYGILLYARDDSDRGVLWWTRIISLGFVAWLFVKVLLDVLGHEIQV